MGCLTVDIRPVSPTVDVVAEGRNDFSVGIANAGNGLDVAVENINSKPTIGIEGRNVHIEVIIALVCRVSLTEKYEYFYVSDEPFVVKDGYFMVSRK